MDRKDSFIQDYLTTHRWAMQRTVLDSLCSVIERHLSGEKLTEEQIQKIAAGRTASVEDPRKYELLADGTAVIHVSGIIAKYSHMVNDISQPRGTSVEFLSQQLALAMSDARAQKIFLRIESPGGFISGLPDFADQVYQASFIKPIIAFADDQASSAAYWIGSQANIFIANKSARVGSIGVYMVIPDTSKRAEMMGVKFNVISTGDHKGAGYPGASVTENQLAVFQEDINADFEMFLSAILRGRSQAGLDAESLLDLSDGREYSAAAAVKNKLIDAVMTLTAALSIEAPETRTEGTNPAASADVHNENRIRKGQIMPETKKKVEAPADAAAEASQPVAGGVEQERSRILSIQSALAGDEFADLSSKAIAEGWDLQQTKAAAFDISQTARQADKTAADAKAAELQTRLDAIAESGHADDLVPNADTTAANPLKGASPTDGDAEAFATAVTGYINGGMTKAAAIKKAQKDSPIDHKAWIASQQPKR